MYFYGISGGRFLALRFTARRPCDISSARTESIAKLALVALGSHGCTYGLEVERKAGGRISTRDHLDGTADCATKPQTNIDSKTTDRGAPDRTLRVDG